MTLQRVVVSGSSMTFRRTRLKELLGVCGFSRTQAGKASHVQQNCGAARFYHA